MTQQKEGLIKHTSLGDAAVNGLCSGVIAGIAMILYLVIAGQLQSVAATLTLSRFDLAGSGSATVGLITHLAMTAVYGIIFGLTCQMIGRRWATQMLISIVLGIVYGLGLFLVAQMMFVSSPDVASTLTEIPVTQFLIAHGLYGLVMGWLINKPREM